MLRIALGVLLLAHGLVTALIWAAPHTPNAPFDAGHSWLIGDSRIVAMPTSLLIAAGLAIAGVGLILTQSWWAPFGLVAGAGSLAFMLAYFSPWLLAGIAINAGIAIAATQTMIATQ